MAPRAASIGELAAAAGAVRVVGDPSTRVTGVAYDSRLVQPGYLFAALAGADVDGHAFVPDAIRRGAVALLVERDLSTGLPEVIAADSRAALAPVAAAFYGHPSRELRVIGITGTDGKTTTSYLVDGILRTASIVTGMIGTVAVRIADRIATHETRQTTPESADVQRYLREMAAAGVEWAVIEATSHGLAMHRLDALRFEIGAVTNITHEHLEYHGTVAAYRRAKAILFERVAVARGSAVVNVDDPGAAEMATYADGATVVRYSAEGRPAELRAERVNLDASGSRFDLRLAGGEVAPVALPLIGGFNVANALCAAGVALAAGVGFESVVRGLEATPAVPGRMARVDAGQPFAVVVDYAHTPESLTKVLALLRRLTPGGRLIAVFGSAGERDTEKRPLQGAVSARLADFSVFTTEDPRFEDPTEIIEQIVSGAEAAGARRGTDYVCITDRREAINHAVATARPGDCVLLAGKGHERSIIWGREKRPWDEAAVAREALAAFGHQLR